MAYMKHNLLATILFILSAPALFAQSASDDFFRSTGKINTVTAVVVILFLVVLFFLIRLDRKVTSLEKQINNE